MTQLSNCRKDFPALSRTSGDLPLAFFDGPAGTQVPRQVIDAIAAYYSHSNANTHGSFVTSLETDALIESCRISVATFLGADAWPTISFGQNMTSLTFALSRAIGRHLMEGDEIVITELDHEANRAPWLRLRDHGVTIHEVALREDGTLDPADFTAKVTSRTRLIALGMASNALGTVNDVARARELADSVGAWLLLDAVHYAPHFPIDVATLRPDFLLCSAYKFYSPHVGILYCRDGLLDQLETDRLRTQDQQAPWRIETGTLNHAALAGVLSGIEYIASHGDGTALRERLLSAFSRIGAHERALGTMLYEGLDSIDGIKVWGPDFAGDRAPTISFTSETLRSDEITRRLAARGITAWDGHFYALRAMEVLDLDQSGGLVRVGITMYNTAGEVQRLLDAVGEIVAGAPAMSAE
jgi:cysteine desulfurase family protein (TIGR01976 family)